MAAENRTWECVFVPKGGDSSMDVDVLMDVAIDAGMGVDIDSEPLSRRRYCYRRGCRCDEMSSLSVSVWHGVPVCAWANIIGLAVLSRLLILSDCIFYFSLILPLVYHI